MSNVYRKGWSSKRGGCKKGKRSRFAKKKNLDASRPLPPFKFLCTLLHNLIQTHTTYWVCKCIYIHTYIHKDIIKIFILQI